MSNRKIGNGITTIILLAICIALTGAIVVKFSQKEEKTGFGRPTQSAAESNVYADEISEGEFVRALKFYATVSDESDSVGIISRTSGYVSEVLVREDDIVQEGQTIGYIDPSSPGASYRKYAVSAKVGGRIESVSAKEGAYINTGSVFAEVKEDPEYVIKVNIPERYIDSIHIGSKAFISSTVRSAIDTVAYVTSISSKIDSQSRTVEVEMKADDNSLFLDGLALTVRLVVDELSSVITVPSGALHTLNGKDYVFVVEEGKAVMRYVTRGADNDSVTVITEGLGKGDVVITEGTVSDGADVNIVEK